MLNCVRNLVFVRFTAPQVPHSCSSLSAALSHAIPAKHVSASSAAQHRQMCYAGAEDPTSPLRTARAVLLQAVPNLVLQTQQLFVVDTQ